MPDRTGVTLVIPAWNEAEAIGAVLDEVPRELVDQVLVVVGGPTDPTAEVARRHRARVLVQRAPGYGAACWTGAEVALADGAEVVAFLDGDYADPPAELARVLAPLRDRATPAQDAAIRAGLGGQCGAAIRSDLDGQRGAAIRADLGGQRGAAIRSDLGGQRGAAIRSDLGGQRGVAIRSDLGGQRGAEAATDLEGVRADLVLGCRDLRWFPDALPVHARLGNQVVLGLLRVLLGARFGDLPSFKAIRADALRAMDMREMTYGWTVEMLVKAARAGLRVEQVDIEYRPRLGGRSKVGGSALGSVRAAGTLLACAVAYATWRPELAGRWSVVSGH